MHRRPSLRAHSSPGRSSGGGAATDALLLEPLERESLMLNLDAALRVYSRHQYFAWTQGLLQNLIRHELLICALYGSDPASLHADAFAAPEVDSAAISEIIHRDTLVVPHIVKTWEERQFRPVVLELGPGSTLADSTLGRELARIGSTGIIAHGTYEVFGKVASLFIFACRPGTIAPKHRLFAELVVPFLHQALVRTRVQRAPGGAAAARKELRLLTVREQEILRWIRVGKSNIEIGIILGVSPLTVKNHVQKILRKLNVQNRTQAVSRALALRILTL
ncbi:MAG: helix-turn-helix transcriptional regulator [Betaproteobacteria bacterium]|nr:helix-turn-helix transcriptional regulator [Betaproteobacteria bacterium]